MATANKEVLIHPRTGSEKKVDKAIYDPIKAAILDSLKGSKGMTFTELADKVTAYIRRKQPGFKGSIPWYTISVRLDLEAKGVVETFTQKGTRLNRLKN